YLAFRKNVLHESALIRNGHYFLNALKRAERKNLTLLWRKLQPMEAGKDVLLVPKYLGEALGYNIHIVCGYDEETIQKMPAECLERMTFIKQPLSFEPKQRIPVYMRYLFSQARNIDLLMCFHRKPETFINLLLYKCLNWRGKTYVKLDTEAGKEWDISSKRGFKRLMHHLLNRLFLSCCHKLSCETEQGYQFLTKQSAYTKQFSKKLVWLPNAFDEEALQALNFKERKFEEKENLIITVGRIGTAQKNTEMLLDAVKQIEWNDWKLCLIGTIESDFQSTITRFFMEYPQLKEHIIFTGPVYDKRKLWEWYNQSKVFVLTSTWESFGIVLTEAQRFKNYLISTEVGGASSLIQQGKYGTLIPQNDSKALADKLQRIINGDVDINFYGSDSPTLRYSDAIKPLLNL
ncbi:MAG: glycosyltransferase, partial [Erysipelotrichaceae bacterium]|nr:glycosyltransferase [Erysipelotrichaceae bacterium]